MFSTSTPRQRPLLRMLIKSMPQGYRRLILLSSLIAFLTNTHRPEKAFIRNMDEALKLSRGGAAGIEFPVRLSRVFWGNQEVFRDEINVLTSSTTTAEAKEQAAKVIVQNVPDWFAYDSVSTIVSDLVRYFEQLKTPVEAVPA